jgi:transposase
VDVDLTPTHPGGAPLKLTPERQLRICDAVRAGVRPEVAAVYCGIGARTYYRYMQYGRGVDADQCYVEFVEAVELALAEWEARDILIIGEAAKEDWHAAAWRLERRLPKIYGRRERHEIANSDEGSFRITAGSHFDPDKLTVAELEQLITLTEKATPENDGQG